MHPELGHQPTALGKGCHYGGAHARSVPRGSLRRGEGRIAVDVRDDERLAAIACGHRVCAERVEGEMVRERGDRHMTVSRAAHELSADDPRLGAVLALDFGI